jgi:hypothetical protein
MENNGLLECKILSKTRAPCHMMHNLVGDPKPAVVVEKRLGIAAGGRPIARHDRAEIISLLFTVVSFMRFNQQLTFSVWAEFTVSIGKKSGLPRGTLLATRLLASSEQVWDPIGSSSAQFCSKPSTVPLRPNMSSQTKSGFIKT